MRNFFGFFNIMKALATEARAPPSLRKSSGLQNPKRPPDVGRKSAVRQQTNTNAAVGVLSRRLQRTSISSPSPNLQLARPKSTAARFLSVPAAGCNTLEDVVAYLVTKKVKNVVAMVGAGISTPSGIPDFRTPGSGLYDNLQAYSIPYPEAIFDLSFFYSNHKPFFTLARELYPNGRYRPNGVHYFLRLLHEKGILLRIYSQNIDGLERLAGIPPEKLVEAHGTFATATCLSCGQQYRGVEVKRALDKKEEPRCTTTGCKGILKPDIVFFGENLPRRFWLHITDLSRCDLLFVMGTSLEVEPFNEIVDKTRYYVPRVLFNREAVGPFRKKRRASDVVVEGDLLTTVGRFLSVIGWEEDHSKLMKQHEAAHAGKVDDELIGGGPIPPKVAPRRPAQGRPGSSNRRDFSTRSGATSAGSTLPRIANSYRPPPSYVRNWQWRQRPPSPSSSSDESSEESSEESSDD